MLYALTPFLVYANIAFLALFHDNNSADCNAHFCIKSDSISVNTYSIKKGQNILGCSVLRRRDCGR